MPSPKPDVPNEPPAESRRDPRSRVVAFKASRPEVDVAERVEAARRLERVEEAGEREPVASEGRELPARRFPDRSAAEQETARAELEARIAAYLKRGRARVVLTDNVRTMLNVKHGDGVYTFRLHHMFVDAPSVVVRALGHYAQRKAGGSDEVLRRYIELNEPKIRTDRRRHQTIDVAGKHHNVQEIFDELNEEYFGGAVQARITWGPRTRRRRGRHSIRLGSYTVEDELIRIHPVLDAEDVPRWFVAGVVFHEMLHEIHDMPLVGGRRVYHTKEFRAAERRFEHYERCVLWERHNLDKLLER